MHNYYAYIPHNTTSTDPLTCYLYICLGIKYEKDRLYFDFSLHPYGNNEVVLVWKS